MFSVGRRGRGREPDRAVSVRWAERKGGLVELPDVGCRQRSEAASVAGVLREGPVASVWFAHFDHAGAIAHVDVEADGEAACVLEYVTPPNGATQPIDNT
jgi:hypothetical protein